MIDGHILNAPVECITACSDRKLDVMKGRYPVQAVVIAPYSAGFSGFHEVHLLAQLPHSDCVL